MTDTGIDATGGSGKTQAQSQMQRLTPSVLGVYGFMALPLALVGYPVAIWLPAFYAGHVGLPLAAVATMLLLAKLTDVVTDPAVGLISDRMRTPFGRRRPLIFLGTPILAVSVWLLFVPPQGVDQYYLLLCIAGMYIGTTLIGLPYGAWGAELSPDYHQRARVTAWREQFTLIGLLVAAFIPFLVEQYGDGTTASIMRGMALAIAISAPLAMLLLFIFVAEPEPQGGAKQAHVSFWDGVRRIWANKPMRMIIGILLIVTLAEAFRNALSLFFMRSVIQAGAVGTLYFGYFVAGLAAVPLWLWLGRKIGKHLSFSAVLITVAIISTINMAFDATTYTMFVIFFMLKGACFGGLQFLPLAMLADVIDVETAETGKARAGSYFAFAGMTSKISTALGTFLAIWALSFTNFNAKLLSENSFDDLLALRVLYAIVPAVFFIFAIVIAVRFPLTAQRQADLQAQITARNTGE
jgi:GPH family glycoside/pentoside/hexuronide:cation symporter